MKGEVRGRAEEVRREREKGCATGLKNLKLQTGSVTSEWRNLGVKRVAGM